MPGITVAPVLADFMNDVDKSLAISKDAATYRELKNGNYQKIHITKLYSITELSFLKLFISWEHFLEETFIRYMCGAKNSSGFPVRSFVNPTCMDHALSIIKQKMQYVDWTVGSEVIERAKLYFRDGEPFVSALGGVLGTLDDMKIIRNRIAHESEKTKRSFNLLVRNRVGYGVRSMGVGKFLLSTIAGISTNPVLDHYGNVLRSSARNIVP